MTTIKDARNRAGYTQREAAEAMGIPLGTLRRWEQGVNQPDIDTIIDLADFYGVSTDELLGSRFAAAEYDSSALTSDEQRLLDIYRQCDQKGREYLLQMAETTAALLGVQP